jgi:DNA-binding NarL/FixJ family response regulator
MRTGSRRDFGPRDRAIVQETQAALVGLIGGPLARFADPSPMALVPQVRRVLRCMLEGDSDKQIARRMKLSPYTVNQYTKVIFRHFRVRSRTELMARWIRRGWSNRPIPPGSRSPHPGI